MAVERKLEDCGLIENPLDRAVAAHTLLAEVDEVRRQVIVRRGEAVLAANRAGATFEAIAEELGVSKPLIQKLVRAAREVESQAVPA